MKIAVPASIMAVVGAFLLNYFTNVQPIVEFTLAGRVFTITMVKLVIAVLIAAFAILELSPRFEILKNQVGVGLIVAAILVAFLGSFIGSRMVKKITMRTIQLIVGVLLLISIALGVGVV